MMLVHDDDEFFQVLQGLLLDNVDRHAESLAQAVGELVVSHPRTVHTDSALILTLGDDWANWAQMSQIASGHRLQSAMRQCGEYACVGVQITPQTRLDPAVLRSRQSLRQTINADESMSVAQQTRACIARRVVDVLTRRVKEAWLRQPARLLDPPEMPELWDHGFHDDDDDDDGEDGGRGGGGRRDNERGGGGEGDDEDSDVEEGGGGRRSRRRDGNNNINNNNNNNNGRRKKRASRGKGDAAGTEVVRF